MTVHQQLPLWGEGKVIPYYLLERPGGKICHRPCKTTRNLRHFVNCQMKLLGTQLSKTQSLASMMNSQNLRGVAVAAARCSSKCIQRLRWFWARKVTLWNSVNIDETPQNGVHTRQYPSTRGPAQIRQRRARSFLGSFVRRNRYLFPFHVTLHPFQAGYVLV